MNKDKTIWTGEQIAEFITPVQNDQIQPNGVDLRVGKIVKNTGSGSLYQDKRKIPSRTPLNIKKGEYRLSKGSYVVVYKETVTIPETAIGLVFPRSSLMRMGARVHTAIWDPGYEGRGEGLLVVHNKHGIHLGKEVRIGQMIFLSASSSSTYNGKYQKERIT